MFLRKVNIQDWEELIRLRNETERKDKYIIIYQKPEYVEKVKSKAKKMFKNDLYVKKFR